MMRSNERYILILIFLSALALRVFAVFNAPGQRIVPTADAADYHGFALSLLSGKGMVDPASKLPTATRVPLYPVFLAFVYSIFGIGNFLAVRLIQCVLGAFLCVIIFYLGKMSFCAKTALLAAVITVFYQPLVFYSFYGGPAFLLSENLFIFVFYLSMLFMVKYFFIRSKARDCIILGVLMGILVLIKPILSLYPFFLFLVDLRKNIFTCAIKRTALVLAGFILLISPWVIRNYFVFKAFVPFSTEGGYALFCSNNPHVTGGGLVRTGTLFTPTEEARVNAMPEVKRDAYYRELAKSFLWKNYKQMPKLMLRKLAAFWDPFDTNYSDGSCVRKYNFWYCVILMFGLIGTAKALKSGLAVNILLPLSVFAYLSVITMVFAGEPRFRSIIEPYLIILASSGVFAVYNFFARKFLAWVVIGSIITMNLFFYTYSNQFLVWIKRLL